MARWFLAAVAVAALLLGTVSLWRMRSLRAGPGPLPAAFPLVLPQRMVWAWEQPEDLRRLQPAVGVAYLAATLLLGRQVEVLPRRQPLRPAGGAPLMTVVRLETRPGFADTPSMRDEVARRLADMAGKGGARALQVDFDALESERPFYAGMLRELRPKMPGGMPLSMTALVSWCGRNSWMRGLPVDEAVPMYFRMGGPRALSGAWGDGAVRDRVTEPLCRSSVGVSTDEPWPRAVRDRWAGRRMYVFSPKPWQPAQMTAMAGEPVSRLEGELAR